jgi:hypothetical protein
VRHDPRRADSPDRPGSGSSTTRPIPLSTAEKADLGFYSWAAHLIPAQRKHGPEPWPPVRKAGDDGPIGLGCLLADFLVISGILGAEGVGDVLVDGVGLAVDAAGVDL